MTVHVSVIMAACNQGDWVRRTVPLAHESLGGVLHEIIVVDDVSTDRCCHGLGDSATVIHARKRLGVSGARRLGFEQSQGDVIIWSDPHCEYPDDALKRLYLRAMDTEAIVQPRTKHRPEKEKTHAGSVLEISDRGLWTKPVGEAAEHPALYNTIYAIRRPVYERIGGWPLLPGVWGYSEQALSLAAWVCGVPIVVDEDSLGIHYLYQEKREFPYSAPRSGWAANCHWVHAAFFPETYETFWLPKIATYFGDDADNTAPLATKDFSRFAEWVAATRTRSEEESFTSLLGIPFPESYLAAQRKRAEPRVHKAARGRVDRALKWMVDQIPGCLKGRHVLDVGTRDGYALTRFADMGALRVQGVELVPEAAAFATENTGHQVDVADMRSLPSEDGQWNIVSCIHALEHVPDPAVALAELVRVTKPGGWLFIVVPLEDSPRERYAHYCAFPTTQSVLDLAASDRRLEKDSARVVEAPYSGEKPEARLLVRRRRKPARETRKRDVKSDGDCHNPKLWTRSERKSTEVEVVEMLAGMVRGLQPRGVVECGSHTGVAAFAIGKALQQNGHGMLYSLEIDEHYHQEASDRCGGLPVSCVHTSSLKWIPPEDFVIDVMYSDSRDKIRLQEFMYYHQWMSPYAVVAFHDMAPRVGKQPRENVERLASEGFIAPVFLPTPLGICIARVLK